MEIKNDQEVSSQIAENSKTFFNKKIYAGVLIVLIASCVGGFYFYKNTLPVSDKMFGEDRVNTFYIEDETVFYNGYKLVSRDGIEADARTFKHLEGSYGADKNSVYHSTFEIKEADRDTFEVLKENNYSFAKDKNYVYKSGYIESDDPDNFVILDKRYSKDSESVFVNGKKIEGADPESFEIIDTLYSRDKNNIYYATKVINVLDPETFEITEGDLSRDKDNLYYGGNIVKDANPETFEILNRYYSKDDQYVFQYDYPTWEKVEDFDPQTFEIIGTACSVERSFTNFIKDKDGVYFGTSIKISDDPDNFEIVDTLSFGGEIPSSETIAKDSTDWYLGCGHKLITDIDLDTSTLEYLNEGRFTDGNNIYEFKKVRLEENALYTRDVMFEVNIIESN
jgi:hypothetical protein